MSMRIIPIAILLTISGVLCGQYGGIRKLYELEDLKQILQQDTLAAFEYKCAKEFHILINEYRASKRIKPLTFSDSLWLVSRNHSVYMAVNREFSHSQKKGKAMFSGVSPSKRIAFVYEEYVNLLYGENIAIMSYNEGSAEAIAMVAFNLWKNSEGHNRNMLDKRYTAHGTAFILRKNEENNYGDFLVTDLLADVKPMLQSDNISTGSQVMVSENNYARNSDNTNGTNSDKSPKFSVSYIKKELGNEFYYLKVRDSLPDQWKRSDRLSKKCLERSDEVLANQTKNKSLKATVAVEGIVSSTDQTLVKPSLINRIFGKEDHTVITVLYGFKEERFDAALIAREVYKSWLENLPREAQQLNYGYHIGVKKKGACYWICAAIEAGE